MTRLSATDRARRASCSTIEVFFGTAPTEAEQRTPEREARSLRYRPAEAWGREGGGRAGVSLLGLRSLSPSVFLAVRERGHATSRGLIWPKDGCASIDLPQRRPATFFPCRLRRHSSRGKKAASRHPPLRFGPCTGAASIASGLTIAIEAAMDATR